MPATMTTAAKIYANHGYTYAQIAEELNVRFSEIRKALINDLINERIDDMSKKNNKAASISSAKKREIIAAYKRGEKITSIAQKIGIGRSTAYSLIDKRKREGEFAFDSNTEKEPAEATTSTSSGQNNLTNNSADIIPQADEYVKPVVDLPDFPELPDLPEVDDPDEAPKGSITSGCEIPWAVAQACRIRVRELIPELKKTVDSAAVHVEEHMEQIRELVCFIGETPDDSVRMQLDELALRLDACKELMRC